MSYQFSTYNRKLKAIVRLPEDYEDELKLRNISIVDLLNVRNKESNLVIVYFQNPENEEEAFLNRIKQHAMMKNLVPEGQKLFIGILDRIEVLLKKINICLFANLKEIRKQSASPTLLRKNNAVREQINDFLMDYNEKKMELNEWMGTYLERELSKLKK